MKRWRGWLTTARVGWLVGVVALLVVGATLWLGADQVLVADEAVEQAEIAVSLAGAPLRRVFGARDLYLQGRVARILISPEPSEPMMAAELARVGLPDTNQIAAQMLAAYGVPAEHVAFLPAPSDSTIQEAERVREWYRGQLPAQIAVVTDPLASRRACWIFAHVLPETRIRCAPTPYDPAATGQWWARRVRVVNIGTEYAKWLGNGIELLVLRRGR
jgi:uncharacterized SAM-binding protein YcdF (DUF218 family)